ncbi:hypothetical protein ATCC90586_011366 [Pythium insidiosum]|nr:hypothetical protein ATCC90586_011366 [Pythium insidiosum]
MDQALQHLGWYVAPREASTIPLQQQTSDRPRPHEASGSLYSPSESCSELEESEPASTDPLSPISHYALLRALNPRGRRRGALAALWAQAERLNYSAYVEWNAAQDHPEAADGLNALDTACRGWSRSPTSLLALLCALPYPEVAISLLPPDIVLRLGNELIANVNHADVTALPGLDDPNGHQLWATLIVLVAVVAGNADVPTLPTERERFFRSLLGVPKPSGTVLLGGDFNCVLAPDLDRSRATTRRQVSPALEELLEAWDLVDAVTDDMLAVETREDVAEFRLRYHTYQYKTPHGDIGASIRRLQKALDTARTAVTGPSACDDSIASVTRRFEALSLDPWERFRSIRTRLITIQQALSARVRLRYRAKHAGAPHESARAFFRRISVKYSRRGIRPLRANPRSRMGPADRVATDWKVITQRPPCDSTLQDAFFAALPTKPALPDLSTIDEPFTEAEVRKAIAACPKGKACGPDGLGNDWYKDMVDVLAPTLAQLFSRWLHNSLPRLVSPTQYGFVYGRKVHDAIDVWEALRVRAGEPDFPPQALAVMLDFAKAYDSLDRRYLALALRRHGFSEKLIAAVHELHLGTTARYVVDGELSSTAQITCGIRQGCPLAPTLFILAVDTLYDLVQASRELQGVPLSPEINITLVGFADDTTAYLRSPAEMPVLADILSLFANVSDLVVNAQKSTALFLREQNPPDMRLLPQANDVFPIAGPLHMVRYLGHHVSTTVQTDAVWLATLQQARTRLHLAEIKTTDVLQRTQVAAAVIVPKLLFTARHAWPTAQQLDRLQRFVHHYVWFGSLSETSDPKRAWLSADIAAEPRDQGGLQLPS